MRSFAKTLGAVVLVGLVAAGFLTAATGCDETAVAGYYEDGYYSYDDYYYDDGYDSGGQYTGGEVLSTYLGNFIEY